MQKIRLIKNILLNQGGCSKHGAHYIRASDYFPELKGSTLNIFSTVTCTKGCSFNSRWIEKTKDLVRIDYDFSSRYSYGSGTWWYDRQTGKRINTNNKKVRIHKLAEAL